MKYVAFLRAINVGGRVVKMDVLREHFELLGFTEVETFIASGNVIFSTRASVASLPAKIEKQLRNALGYEVDTFVRTLAEVGNVARHKPFAESLLKSAGALNVGFLHQPLDRESLEVLMSLKTALDDFHVFGREVYWLCAKKQSESTFTNVKFERVAKVRATFRGFNTVAKLAAKYPPLS